MEEGGGLINNKKERALTAPVSYKIIIAVEVIMSGILYSKRLRNPKFLNPRFWLILIRNNYQKIFRLVISTQTQKKCSNC